MNSAEKVHEFIKLSPIKKKQEGSSWSLSYGDMVTALLCFFIIFYAIEKQNEKIINNPLKEYSETEGILNEHKSTLIDTEYKYAIESIEKIPGIEVMRSSSFVDIYFSKTVFFATGETKLTREGKIVLDDVIGRLSKIEGKYTMEIQGHADSTPVKQRKNRWWNSNMELSVLRALTVHSYLSENYIEKNKLIVSGHGNQKKMSDSQSESEDINRRISLRLQLVK